MKIIINTNYKKLLKYFIYDINGEARILNSKGKIIGHSEIEFFPKSEEIIVRVRKNNIVLLYIKWFFIMILGVFKRYGSPEILMIHIYNDVHILKIDPNKDLQMYYRDMVSDVTSPGGDVEMTDNLKFYCTNYPSISEAKVNKKINRVLKRAVLLLLMIGIIAVFVYAIIIRLPS